MNALLLILAFGVTGCTKHEYNDGRGLVGQLEREVVALQQKNRILEHQAMTCADGGPPDPLYAELAQIFRDSEHNLHRRANVTVLTVPGSHLFASDRMAIREEAAKTLDILGMVLSSHGDHTVIIEGHVSVDTMTQELHRDYRDEWGLSFARAELVQRELVQKYSVGGHRFTVSARGTYDPVSNNDTEAGRKQNERVVLYIYPPGAR